MEPVGRDALRREMSELKIDEQPSSDVISRENQPMGVHSDRALKQPEMQDEAQPPTTTTLRTNESIPVLAFRHQSSPRHNVDLLCKQVSVCPHTIAGPGRYVLKIRKTCHYLAAHVQVDKTALRNPRRVRCES